MPLSDRDLIEAVRRGQIDAFATLIGRYRDLHTRFAMRMLGGYQAADDALQSAFARACRTPVRCKDPDQFGDWLSLIVVNEVRSCAMRRTVRASRSTGEMAAIIAGPAPGSDPAAEVQRALDQLDPINREAFVLQYVEQMSYDEISALTGTPVPALEARVDRACARLRELLARMYAEHRQAAAASAGDPLDPGVPFVARIAAPLRKPEVLDESFDDRLIARLLGPAESSEPPSGPTMESTTMAEEPVVSTAGEVDAPRPLDRFTRSPRLLALVSVLVVAAFASGYLVQAGVTDTAAPPSPVAPTRPAETTVVRRVDTVRLVRAETVHVVRFVYADRAAKSVAIAGDFNGWSAKATPLTRAPSNGVWSASLPLSAGGHKYAFVVDGKRRPTDSLAMSSRKPPAAPSVTLAGTPAPSASTTRTAVAKAAANKPTDTKSAAPKAGTSKSASAKPTPSKTGTSKPATTKTPKPTEVKRKPGTATSSR